MVILRSIAALLPQSLVLLIFGAHLDISSEWNYASLEFQRRFGETFSVGVAYNYYEMKLDSRDDDLTGVIQVRHHGPVLFISAGF